MGIAIPQVVTASRATGAQVIDGSLKFDGSKSNRLIRTFGSAGNRTSWTWSCWTKRDLLTLSNRQVIFGGFSASNNTDWLEIGWDDSNDHVYWTSNGVTSDGTAQRRDPASWYHFFSTYDGSNLRIYVNNRLDLDYSVTGNMGINVAGAHYIGQSPKNLEDRHLDGRLTQCYFIDGQVLNPSDFAFTDPLTNTWKPKKYTGTFTGTNTFYLPFDGSAPIGQDQSGNGNDFTPVNFGGTVELDSPLVTGARPILNTLPGGAQPGVGVFGSKQNVGYAVTVYDDGGGNKYYIDGVKQDTVTGLIRGATYTFDTSDSTVSSHPFRFSATSNGSHGGGSEYTNGVAAITGAATTITVPHDAPNTLYYYCTSHSGMGADITGITTNEKLADQYASNIVFASPLVGANNDVCASIACTMTNKSVTSNDHAAASGEQSNFYAGSFEFDGASDYLNSSSSSDLSFGTGDFTVECWVYQTSASSAEDGIFQISTNSAGLNASNSNTITLQTNSGAYRIYANDTSTAMSTSVITDKWVHLAVVRDSGTTKLFVNGIQDATTISDSRNYSGTYLAIGGYYSSSYLWVGYIQDFRVYKGLAKYTSNFVVPATSPDIIPDTPSGVSGSSKLTKITDGAVSFDGPTNGASVGTGYLTIPSSDSSDFNFGTGDFTWEAFVYCDDWTGGSSNDDQFVIAHAPSDNNNISGLFVDGGQSYYYSNKASSRNIITGPVLVDKRWYHIAASRESGTLRLFVDGISVGSASYTDSYADAIFTLGRNEDNNKNQFRGFISNFRVIKGTALYTSRFTPPTEPLTNVTNTKLLCCQSPTSATEAAVTPGTITANGDAAATTFNPLNTDIHTVRGQETGYATLNPLRGELTLSDGNLHAVGVSNWGSQTADFLMSSGKWYYEYHDVVSNEHVIGIGPPDVSITGNLGSGTPPGFGYGSETGAKYSDGGNSSYGASWTSGDVIGVAFDADAGELSFYKNGIDQGVAFTGLTTEYVPVISINATSRSASVNFGQKPFKFPPPDGFQPLNAANVRPETVIVRPDQYVGIITYTGNGTTGQSLKGLNFDANPDLVWIKSRSFANNHHLFDTVRGPNNILRSSTTGVEDSSKAVMPSFDFNGFSVDEVTGNNATNDDGSTFVAWCWKAGGNKNTFNVDNVGYSTYTTAPGLDEGVLKISGASVGTKQGFSIIKYVGNASQPTTVPHGLNSALDFMIVKNIDTTNNWAVFHKDLIDGGTVRYLRLNTTDGQVTGSGHFGNTAPTDTVFTLGSDDQVNKLNSDFIAYCWHNVPGLQKFGSFTTNNSSKEYVHLGFKPAIVWIKRTGKGSTTNLTTYGSWYVNDSEMSPINPASYEEVLWLNRDYAEGKRGNGGGAGTYLNVDFLSDGFRLRGTANAEIGQPNDINIYCAWAEAPSVDLFGGGANAR